jgi:uncharacterized protein YycO
MKLWRTMHDSLANVVCRSLVALVDVRLRKRVRRLSENEKMYVASLIRPGDILIDSNDAYPGWQLLTKIFLGSDWVHMGYYVGDGKVVDAGRETHVAEITLNRFLRTSRVAILRPEYYEQDDLAAALACAREFVGKPYNRSLNLANLDDVYCTQMMREVLQRMPHPIEIRSTNVLGRHIVSPDAFLDNAAISVIFKTRLSDAAPPEMADQAA